MMATSITNANYVMNRIPILLLLLILNFSTNENLLVQCRKSPSSSSSSHRKSSSTSSRSSGSNKHKSSSKTKKSKVLSPYDDEDDDDVDDYNNIGEEEDDEGLGFLNEEEEDDEYDEDSEDDILPSKRRPQQPQSQRRKGSKSRSRKAPSSSSSRYEEDEYDNYDDDEYDIEEDDYRPPTSRRGPPPQQRRRGPPSSSRVDPRRSSKQRGHVVPYTKHRKQAPQPGTLTKGITFLRDSLPSPTNLKDTTLSAISSAKETTSKFSKDIYREVKGLTSSELEQVMLKATKPDDSPIKSKHVERLVGVTYQISGRYDIYDAVLRKLWNKMAELDWRSKLKALYILHRFSADGSPDHQAALKARLRELRRTKDPKRKGNYFNSKILLLTVPQQPQKKQQQLESATDTTIPYRAFLARYAHYVLLRAQCFSGMFNEITSSSSKGKKGSSSNNNNSLKQEHLQASQLLLKAAVSCQFTSSSEECEMTSIALERVAMDLMGLTSSVASSLTASLKKSDSCSVDQKILLKKWCEFYSQNLRPQTKSFVKKASVSLDKYGLFLPSRMSATVSQELLSKGLQFSEDEEEEEQEEEKEDTKDDEEKEEKIEEKEEEEEEKIEEIKEEEEEDSDDEEDEAEEDEDEDDEYEEEYEYDEYDD